MFARWAPPKKGPVGTGPSEREMRFELTTSTLARLHSTAELFPQKERLGSAAGAGRQALGTSAGGALDAPDQGSFTVENSSHIASLASMSVVLSPRSPSIRQGWPGQQWPPPSMVQTVTLASPLHWSTVSQVAMPF